MIRVPSVREKPDTSEAITSTPSRSPSEYTGKQTEDGETAKRIKDTKADEQAQEDDETTVYPKKLQFGLICIALCLSVFLMTLDNNIIATAIPRITDEFNSINDVGWYGSAYLLTSCAFGLFFGKLYTFFSIKWVYFTAIAIFEIGSVICGAAPNSKALITGRAVAGLGSAGIFSGGILILASTVPLRQRPAYTGLLGGMYGIAAVAGPLMGGAFTDKVSWRWCFYINLPIGAVTLAFIGFFYHPTTHAKMIAKGWKDRLEQLDLYGTIIFLPMIVCLLLILQWGGSRYLWSNSKIIALFVVFGILLITFGAIQVWKKDNATIPLRIIKQRSVASGAWFSFSLGASFFVFIFFLPIWFQAIKGVSAVESGIRNIPMTVALVIATIIAGLAVTKVGYYTPFVIISMVAMSIGSGLLSTLKVGSGSSEWIGYEVLFGAGVGFGMQQPLMAVQTVLPTQDIPIGTVMMLYVQTLGGTIFISVAQNVFTNKLRTNLIANVPDINPALVLTTGATSLKNYIDPKFLPAVQIAYNAAIMDAFYVAIAMAALSTFGAVFLEWKSMKGNKKIEMTAGKTAVAKKL